MSIFDHFTHLTLSPVQESALEKLQAFLEGPAEVFMLKGYAGSGKTTILKGLVEYLNDLGKDFVLMAPTGRAAKVIRERTGQEAYTIHKSIYSFDELQELEEGESFLYYYKIRNNTDVNGKIFIVDEASMISDVKHEEEFFRFGTGCLLSDLITYSRVGHEKINSKIIFVGDPCQLPPVGDSNSKAFNSSYLEVKFRISSAEAEMKEVKRQSGESGILKAAAKIRKSISAGFYNDFDLRDNGKDILNPSYEEFLRTWMQLQCLRSSLQVKIKPVLTLTCK
jgi:ATP-dependent exoDNAse (exonuclease V) alpha subunit